MSVAVVAEKPSVARDLARVLGARRRGEGFLHGNGYTVTWAIGHLVALPEPHQIDPRWARWRRETLPMLPRRWPLEVCAETRQQFEVVRRIINEAEAELVICATDAGREGELIFRQLYEAAGCSKPVRRLWISSLTDEAIREGFRNLREGHELDPLADAARGRSRADWLVGMNLSRACTLAQGETFAVGRVQTPTLAMVVERELAIRAFVPEDYMEVEATFAPLADLGSDVGLSYRGTYFPGAAPSRKAKRLAAEGAEAERIVQRARTGRAQVETITARERRLPPPLLYDLTELQRHANRLFGFSAKKSLALAQTLYERWKLISYPRTDSKHLSRDVASTLGRVVDATRAPYEALLAPGTGERTLGRRFVDDARVTDHHAIIPTTTPAAGLELKRDERRIYDLICRRLLAAWHGDFRYSVTEAITAVASGPGDGSDEAVVDRFHSVGRTVRRRGWKVLEVEVAREERESSTARGLTPATETAPADQELPSELASGQPLEVLDARAVAKKTRPPQRFTDATLLTAMEKAGSTLSDKELSAAMRETGLGTPATRAETIENLLRRRYLARSGKLLEATAAGIRLVEAVHPAVKSPEMTGRWEAELARIQRGGGSLDSFMCGIEAFVRKAVAAQLSTAAPEISEPAAEKERVDAPPGRAAAQRSSPPSERHDEAPSRPGSHAGAAACATDRPPPERLAELLAKGFGHPSFRPFQEAVCRAALDGEDVLLVMPTGAGKSLCYQLPGLARGGTTLVISPLIALMEDQVAKLGALGLRAERIHSGRDRAASRRVCLDYLAGDLDYLFIAPERLSVPGFPEMLARRKPVLVAVDEAHCISHWGHDFRPDYRMLGQRLPLLRPAPIMALTATATPLVQDDIAEQLGQNRVSRFIHGFRRTNLAIEVAELPPSARPATVHALLRRPERRPAIVYTPTRRQAESLSLALQHEIPAAAYHAGRTAADRDRVQGAFVSGELEVIVATIAFGMGVDKADVRSVVHTGLPSSLEGYYQEIGRAGRDGLPCRAVLLYSFADRRTHEYFHRRDYPEPAVLDQLFTTLRAEPRAREQLREVSSLEPEIFDCSLDKLWIHGGALVDPEDRVSRGSADWRRPYDAQRRHKLTQLEQVTRLAEAHACRMLHVVRHFGDQEDSGEACGICDVCAPERCTVQRFRAPSPQEEAAIGSVIAALRRRHPQSTGRLYRQVTEGASLDRRTFERLLGGLTRAGLVRVRQDSFSREGRTIHFSRADLTPAGVRETPEARSRIRVADPFPSGAAPRRRRAPPARQRPKAEPRVAAAESDPSADLVAALKSWRLAVARRRRIPAFRVLADRTVLEIASRRPRDEHGLLAVHGIGPAKARKYGEQILRIVAEHPG